ncbi:methyltransferase domain-containing protein [Halopseudomonas yangmingensis]|uniref:Methyltransferase domain-containing protein n=1 Tax=Halopseudomonas yangmingensis TaxID=1720063 RepID=A0A1I4RLW9_9GAMM|nr:methyltransferase domain-containing protein [Halopseudomonas yangmingensis]SFM53202.1 Methyltransferase domain-containing protein [Halopseudomonas yangmingensis]
MRRHRRVGDISQQDLQQLLQEARDWLDTESGRQLLLAEGQALEQAMQRCFGRHLVQFGLHRELLPGADCGIACCWRADQLDSNADLLIEEGAWPFEPHSLDVLVLHHALDFTLAPHAVLREAALMVRPGGHLLLFGFNPWSLWGGAHLIGRGWLGEAGFIAPARLADWLALLGFGVEKPLSGCYRPPLRSARWLERLQWMERRGQRQALPCGGFYLLQARRQMPGINADPVRRPLFRRLDVPALTAGSRRHSGRQSLYRSPY